MRVYDQSNKWWIIGLIIIGTIEVSATVWLPTNKGELFNHLDIKDNLIYWSIGLLALNYIILEISQSIKNYFQTAAAIKIRVTASHRLLPIVANLTSGHQRIQDDVKTYFVNFITTYYESFVSLFIIIGIMCFTFNSWTIRLLAIVYFLIVFFVVKHFNIKLRAQENKVREEETILRDSIKLSKKLDQLETTNSANLKLASVKLRYFLSARSTNIFMEIVPYIILTPLYLNDMFTLGVFITLASGATLISGNVTWLCALYPQITQGQACLDRINELKTGGRQ